MSDFHEQFETGAADHEAVATDTPEAETVEVDAGGAGFGHSSAEPAVTAGSDDTPELTDIDGDGAADVDTDGPDAEPDLDALAARAGQADEYLALAQRTRADFDNFRKRAARDAALAAERGTMKLARELLPALDNLERAIVHAAEEDPLLDGIKLVHSDLLAALNRAGIESFSPAGESFDPQLHEAVAQHPQEGTEPGTVLEVYQPGYRLADTVLRPARVLVAA